MSCSRAQRRRSSAGRSPAVGGEGLAVDAERRRQRQPRLCAGRPRRAWRRAGLPRRPTRHSGGRAGRGNAAAVPLTGEPAPLVALASAGGETGKRAQALLARLTWPGKPAAPGAAPAAAPLTAAEQKRFEDGKTVYTTLCVACHNENGDGREKLGPTLVGSPFALSQPHVPMRILINGKEGSVGLMPPLGTTLSDDRIAGVLTFVRRSWGNQGSAVDPAAVADVRKQTSSRTRPWTEKELLEIAGK